MKDGVFDSSGLPGAASHLDDCVHFLLYGRSYWLVHVDISLMRNLYFINTYTYIHFIYFIVHKQSHLLAAFCSTDKYSIAQNQWLSTYCSIPTFPLLLRIPYLLWIMVHMDTLKLAWIWKKMHI